MKSKHQQNKNSRPYNRPISSHPSDEVSVGVGGSDVVVLVTLKAGDIIWGPQQPEGKRESHQVAGTMCNTASKTS